MTKFAHSSVLPPIDTNEPRLLEQAAPFLAMSEAKLLKLVPPQAGFFFSGSPSTTQGAQENNIVWDLSMGDKVQCKFSKEFFPSEKYPENGQIELTTPTGKKQIIRYHQAADGKKYWFSMRRWYEQRMLLEKAAYSLAQLYRLDTNKYGEAGKRSALIIKEFARVYPDYIIKFDHPGKDKRFYENSNSAADYKNIPDGTFRLTKWSWWAYMDISDQLLRAYDQLAQSPFFTAEDKNRIENQFFGAMLSFVQQYDAAPLTNMHPTLWRTQAVASHVLNRPQLAEKILSGIQLMVQTKFTYDGFWMESSPSYHQQSTLGLRIVLQQIYPGKSATEIEQTLLTDYPALHRTLTAANAFRLPNGFYAALNDSWANQRYSPVITSSTPQLMPATGYGILGGGEKENQFQAHLKFTGRFGHDHYDSLNLLFFAAGKELISDLGYTHTKARPWAATTAAHNTVVIDGENQSTGGGPHRSKGNLELFSAGEPTFQVIEASAPQSYPQKATDYRRTLVTVRNGDQQPYLIDIFHVAGGNQHDWLLHGSADEAQQLTLTDAQDNLLGLSPLSSLLPAEYEFEMPVNENRTDLITKGPWAYGNFKNVSTVTSNAIVKAKFQSQDKSGLESWIIPDGQSTFHTVQSWNVRGSGEDDSKLDDHLRQGLIVRRTGNKNRFIALHAPQGASVKNVTLLPWNSQGFALKIERLDGTDYFIYQNQPLAHEAVLDGQQVAFDGRIALIQQNSNNTQLKMLGGTSLTFGETQLKGALNRSRLINITGNTLEVEGKFEIAPNEVLLLQHSDGNTTALHVASSEFDGKNTKIQTRELPTLTLLDNGKLKLTTFPNFEYNGPHYAVSYSLAQATN